MKYLLPCSCGESVAVEVGQAGQSVRCTCGNTLAVPAMRLIRQLSPASATTSTTHLRDRTWSRTQRLLFTGGLAVLVGGLGTAGFFQLGRAGLETEAIPWDNLERSRQDIDQMSIGETWELWTIARTDAIGPYAPPLFIRHQFLSAKWRRVVVGSLVVAAVGLVVLLSAFLGRRRAKPRVRPTATKT